MFSDLVFWGGREGYFSLLNTNVRKELDHMAIFFKMAISEYFLPYMLSMRRQLLFVYNYLRICLPDYKEKIGFEGQLLIEPKAKEPTRHQYDYGKI